MRKINPKLLDRLTKGDLVPLLEYVRSDQELRLEIRQKGEAFIYYKKGKALEIGSLKVDEKYGSIPSTELAITDPPEYFRRIKTTIDNWLENIKDREEFETQQNIAQSNQRAEDKYLVVDMEYAFEQDRLERNKRVKRGVFDLIGIERQTNRIVFFEVKKGMGATQGKSGILDHIKDFNAYLFEKNNSAFFRANLVRDLRNIIEDKIKLSLLNPFEIPDNLEQLDPELIFVFHPKHDSSHPEHDAEVHRFCEELRVASKIFCDTVSPVNFLSDEPIVVSESNYKLK